MKHKYEPKLSRELRTFLEQQGTLDKFLNDYRQMCTNFNPSKIYIPGLEEKPKNRENMTDAEKRELEKLGRSYAHALHQLLELAVRLHKKGKNYTIIGGFGVLGHLYDHNHNFPVKWRGTEDIDILSADDLTDVYRELGFERRVEKVDTNGIPDGVLNTYIHENPYHDRPVKIQDRRTIKFPGGNRDEAGAVHREHDLINLYGVPLRVASKKHLIKTKRGIRTRKDKLGHLKDKHDIEHLLSVKKLEDRI